jgi:phosphopantothenoylcysteine decarboxylase/phosphopantothenate--cysteine ligase
MPLKGPLTGRRVLITAGPTQEPIDPVRYISNRSSGKQGFAIAQAAAEAGAHVVLVTGPVDLPDPAGVEVIRIESARDMLARVETALPVDVAIFAAAVADWRVARETDQKIKKTNEGTPPALALVENPDILKTISRSATRPRLVVGFAAETQDLLKNAQAKLARKGCDWIVANDVSPQSGVMGGDNNTIHIVTHSGVEPWPTMTKTQVAAKLVERIAAELKDSKI